MFFILGLCILLAAMLLINSIASFFVAVLWRALGNHARGWSAGSRTSFIFVLRIVPVAMGITSAVLLIAPAYLTHESRTDHEEVSLGLAMVAAFAAVGIGLAVLRGLLTWRATARLTSDWLKHAKEIRLSGIEVPCYELDHQFPVIAVVGTFRPRLFVASRVLQSLNSGELKAAIKHEAGHLVQGVNLMRGLMRACRDSLLIIPFGRSLDTAWKEASEEAADDYAARTSAGAALDLASSLIKISRMVPAGRSPIMPAGAFFISHDDSGAFSSRVRHLLSIANDSKRLSKGSRTKKRVILLPILFMVITVAGASSEPHVLAMTHALIEEVVSVLT